MIFLQILFYVILGLLSVFMSVVLINNTFDLRLFRKMFAKIALRRMKKKAEKIAKKNGETIYLD